MQDGIGRHRMPFLVRHEALKHCVMEKVESQGRGLSNFIRGVGAKLGWIKISVVQIDSNFPSLQPFSVTGELSVDLHRNQERLWKAGH
jgi:hypothetical protein